jgi:hypothetical protein
LSKNILTNTPRAPELPVIVSFDLDHHSSSHLLAVL